MNLAEQPQSVRKLVPAKCMQQIYIQHSGRRHLQYSEITTSILCGIILDFLSLCVSVLPISVRQLFEFLTTSQLTRRNVCAILKIAHYFYSNWSDQNIMKGLIPVVKSGGHVCISKAVKVSPRDPERRNATKAPSAYTISYGLFWKAIESREYSREISQ